MNQTSTTQQGLNKHGGLHSTTGAHGMRAHNSNKPQTIMFDIAVYIAFSFFCFVYVYLILRWQG